MKLQLINDGMTRDVFLDCLYGEVRFSYRPLRSEQRTTVFDLITKAESGGSADRIIAKTMAKRIKSWDILNGDGVADISEEVIRMIPPDAFDRMFSCINGSRAGDIDPLVTQPSKMEEAALQSDQLFGDALSEEIEGNSGGG